MTHLLLLLLAPASAADAAEKIINGDQASEEEYPQAGALLVEAGGYRVFTCSSTLIAPDVVLTAAHCIDPESLQASGFPADGSTRWVWTREADVTRFSGAGTVDWPDDAVFGREQVFHESWDIWGLSVGLALNYDVGLIFLEEAVLDIEPALLPTAEEALQLIEGVDVVAVGWGYQDQQGRDWGVKQQGWSPVGGASDYEFQVGPDTEDVRKCHGDSGGPSFQFIETDTIDDMRVVGITSHAYDNTDCSSTGGVDTRVDYYLDWIDEKMRERCDDGSRVWCEEAGIIPAPVFEEGEDPWDVPTDMVSDVEKVGCSAAPAGGAGAAGFLAMALVGWRRRRS